MAKRRDPRRSADRAKMRADEVARQRDAELLHKDQFKNFKGNLGMSDETPNRGVKYMKNTPENVGLISETKKKDMPPKSGDMLF